VILVKPGEKVPADGIIVEGSSYLNESMLTGESKPVKKEEKDKIKFGDDNYLSNLQAQTASRPSGIELIQKLRKKRINGND